MDKDWTQKELKDKIKALEKERDELRHCTDPEYLELMKKVRDIKDKWFKEKEPVRDDLYSQIQLTKQDLEAVKNKNKLHIPIEIEEWFRRYSSGIDFGYKPLKIRWISDCENWVIVTNPGGTAGTGTAMGTGGYYYGSAEHFLARVGNGEYSRALVDLNTSEESYEPENSYPGWNQYGEVEGGRLTKETKQKLIDMIPQLEKRYQERK